ncbi:hypothetical protein KSP40_PGU017719 [Platanthera guangdongensis]|uniref:Uncharacterized protein n=1 Tax=Platanthera guangdongensis TaxID=2320717 RepID=A0ABR2M5H3_9ASPA
MLNNLQVPGKSAQDCFDKIHASIITPLSAQPRLKTRAHGFSPIANFSLSDMISPQASKLEAGRLGKTRTKKLAAHKTVRHLLRKHSIIDRSMAIDRFSLLESSLINISSLATLQSPETSSLSQQPDTKSSSNLTMFTRFKLLHSPTAPSPEVLKQIKNRALHDRYIDQLHHREARRAMLAKKSNAGGVGGKSDHGA